MRDHIAAISDDMRKTRAKCEDSTHRAHVHAYPNREHKNRKRTANEPIAVACSMLHAQRRLSHLLLHSAPRRSIRSIQSSPPAVLDCTLRMAHRMRTCAPLQSSKHDMHV